MSFILSYRYRRIDMKFIFQKFIPFFVLIIFSALIISCENPTESKEPDYDYTVQYKITGSASLVDVTLNNSTGGTEQYDNVPVPKIYSYKYFEDWFLYISAQNQGQTGTVTVSIYYKDNLFKTSTSSGAYVIATASGSKP